MTSERCRGGCWPTLAVHEGLPEEFLSLSLSDLGVVVRRLAEKVGLDRGIFFLVLLEKGRMDEGRPQTIIS